MVDNYIALPSQQSLYEWDFVIFGLEGIFECGFYFGKLYFPSNFPFSGPKIVFKSPTGRFIAGSEIEAIKDWSPVFGINEILCKLIAFMEDAEGSLDSSVTLIERIAMNSALSLSKNVDFQGSFSSFFELIDFDLAVQMAQLNLLKELRERQEQSLKAAKADRRVMVVMINRDVEDTDEDFSPAM